VTAAKATPVADDDPFAVDQSQHAGALPVQARKSAGKTLEVVCPMCETHGFIAQNAAGKQVRCCNPKCLVPVFEAPIPRKEAPPPPPPPPKPLGKWIAGGVVVLAMIGAITFWWLHRDDLTKELRVEGFPTRIRKTDADGPKLPAEDVKPAEIVKTSLEWQRAALAKVIEIAQSRDNNRKPTCRRLSATDAIILNDLGQAKIELEQLAKVGPQVPYEAVPPLTLMAWKQRQVGSKEFPSTVAAAFQAARKLPERGRHAAESAIALAAVLSLENREVEGHSLIANRQNGAPLNDLAALYEIALHDGSFNLTRAFAGQITGRWERPLSTAVTYILLLHGEQDAAKRWATSDTDVLAKSESLLLWSTLVAERALSGGQGGDLNRAAEAVATLSPSAQSCYFARLADMQRLRKNSAAEASLEAAQKLQSVAAPPPMRLNNIKDVLNWSEPENKAATIAAARGAVELAIVQASFGPAQAAAAGKSLNLALSHLRSLAPSVEAVQTVELSLLKGGPDDARQQLQKLFNLETPEEARRKLVQFNAALRQVQQAAEFRFRLQCELLIAGLNQGLLDEVAREMEAHVSAADPNDRERYLETAIPQLLAQKFATAGKAERRQAMVTLIGDTRPKPENMEPLIRAEANALIAAGKVTEAAAVLNQHLRDDGALYLDALRLACRLTQDGKFEPLTREFLGALGTNKEQELREDGLRLTAALAVLVNQEKTVFKAAESESDRHAVACSLFSGLIEGLARRIVPSEALPTKDAHDGKKGPAKAAAVKKPTK
jgi:hypothetical protein